MLNLAVLTPTFCRPKLVENSIAQFLKQTYPEANRRMYILDDSGVVLPSPYVSARDNVFYMSDRTRHPSLSEKYDWLVAVDKGWADALVVWDDDDIYLPRYLETHAKALDVRPWSHPTNVWSLYTGYPQLEGAAGRFHGSLALCRDLYNAIGGWQNVLPPGQPRRADFDQRMISACEKVSGVPGRPDDPKVVGGDWGPQYVFRWRSTNAPHCQGYMLSPENETWYEEYAKSHDRTHTHWISAEASMDAETVDLWRRLGGVL